MAMGIPHGRGDREPRPQLRPFDPDAMPPHNIEAEQGVLGAILLDNSVLALDEVTRLTVADFFRDTHQIIYAAMRRLEKEGAPIDGITLANELKRIGKFDDVDGDIGLFELSEKVVHLHNVRAHANIIREKHIARMVEDRALLDAADVRSNNYTAEELIRRSAERASAIESLSVAREADLGLRPWPDQPDPAVWHGLAGEICQMIAPHTEADPMAILTQILVFFGSIVGCKPHWRVESSRHGCNLFVAVVGNSSKARKGTSYDQVRALFAGCDPAWNGECVKHGLVSGEGMIFEVRDPVVRREKVGGDNRIGGGGYQEMIIDPGIDDKRALFVETEFGSTLSALSRDGNTLCGYIRQAWDGQSLRAATKNNPTKATGAHISIIGHVTTEELHRRLSHNDAANGFANRFLWVCARRSNILSRGGKIHTVDFSDVFRRLNQAVEFATEDFSATLTGRLMTLDHAGGELWDSVYPKLSEPKPGLLGAVTSRAEAQTLRIATIYALLDQSPWIGLPHLKAALALWRYCEQSAAYIFGDALGDADSEKLLAALEEAGAEGLTRTAIRRHVFGNGAKAEERMDAACAVLTRNALAELVTKQTGGCPAKVWVATSYLRSAEKTEKTEKSPPSRSKRK